MKPVLQTTHLSIGYLKNKRANVVQKNLNLELREGEMVCLIGQNGCGKSTLLRTLAGLQNPLNGQVFIAGKSLSNYKIHEKANMLALVLTDRIDIEHATVFDLVSLGRQPYGNWWSKLSKIDQTIIDESIELVHLSHKAHTAMNELSDGERQRAMIAKALAQDTPIILLDEPTAHLDLPNRVEIMLLLHRLAHTQAKCVLISTHELDMALQAADRIWLMSTESGIESGIPEDLVLLGHFNDAFQSNAYYFNSDNGNFSMNYALKHKIWVEGHKARTYWTLRALARAGFAVVADAETKIVVSETNWELNGELHDSVGSLLRTLQKLYS